ncbi:MAG TPA: hypothetical protein VKS01_12275, partial [Bryobacteraceae bacterium]|nr:hypothetical protein [Bryobacteraceae bacterium]
MQRKILALGFWLTPPVFALLVYRYALNTWFHEDDFVWLTLLPGIHSWADLRYALFQPTVHGTWRPLGERAFFLILQSIFGYTSALPFRLAAFALQFVNLALIAKITQRITGSRLAALIAPILWIASDKQVLIMAWSSDINYISCAFFLLMALWFLIRHCDTGRRGYLIGMWAMFLCALCAVEMAVMFPAMAASYTWVRARKYFKTTLPLFGASAIFAVLHAIFAPDQEAGPYHMHVDASIFSTLGQYWKLALEPINLSIFTRFPESVGIAAMIAFTVALLGYAGYQAWRRNLTPMMLLAWFALLITPVLPLPEHVTPYYVCLALIGLAMLAGDAFAKAWAQPGIWRAAGLLLVALFLAESVPVAYKGTWWYQNRSAKVRDMVLAVEQAHKRHLGSTILMTGVEDDLFWGALQQHCFRFLGYGDGYIDKSSLPYIPRRPEVDVMNFVLPDDKIRDLYNRGQLAVYRWIGDGVADETATYRPPAADASEAAASLDRVDAANPAAAGRLSGDWYPMANDSRWMGKQASVHLRSPASGDHKLRISGYCPAILLKQGPLHLTIGIAGQAIAPLTIAKPDAFEFEWPLPSRLPHEFEVTLQIDRTTRV